MRVISLNVGKSRSIQWKGKNIVTAIGKAPTAERLRVSGYLISGDEQADPRYHGGEFKAVYSYAREHYDFWQAELPGRELPYGIFGENLTTQGLDESTVLLGDQLQIGTVVLEAIQPRFPCSKLGARFQDDAIIKRFLKSGRLGIYYRVVREGEFAAGDAINLLKRDPASAPAMEIARLNEKSSTDAPAITRLLANPYLIDEWRDNLRRKLDAATRAHPRRR